MVKYIWLTKRKIRELIDVPRVERAIEAAERLTSGEIRVSISPWFWGSPERAADEAFSRLGMTETREQNGVLFLVVPSRRTFVVRGDRGIHERVGQSFWDEIADIMSSYFRRGQLTDVGVVAARRKRLRIHVEVHVGLQRVGQTELRRVRASIDFTEDVAPAVRCVGASRQ